ncbi:MAG: tRNA (adenosine(37)-N6)-threonylcarbamoyltransferase complex ATPase subunit type 1 TsaE [Clostridia bacterium]|nr:tRNA (adenosine(37)-N6)-threonylcarbamoyltransferase complex ATPase subunit type 1 TsaE [Clostridia bacterium]
MVSIITQSEKQTILLGEKIGRNAFAGMIVLLYGDLGSGKTHLTKGIAKGLEVGGTVSSPTYTILFEHSGRLPLNHFDLYRITGEDDFFEIGGYEYIQSSGVCVLEWADRLDWSKYDRLEISIEILDDNSREIKLVPFGERYKDWLELL